MILLDDLDKHDDQQPPKLMAEASSLPLVRVQTPTPSLPPYEASPAQPGLGLAQPRESRDSQLRLTTYSYDDIQAKRTRRRKCRKITIYALATYFVLTVVIGVPVLVVKLRRKVTIRSNPYEHQPWEDTAPPIPPRTITLGDAPLRLSNARSCNTWNVKDRPEGDMFVSQLDYTVPVNGSVFLNTNISYAMNSSYLNQFSGSLLVAVNDDPAVTDGLVRVTMHHTSTKVGGDMNVCLMNTGLGGGVYLFAPQTLSPPDALMFNITLLLPQNNTSPRHISQLLCHLPNFQHTYRQLDPDVTIGTAIFGGALSSVYVESVQAGSAIVKASSAEIRGKFSVSTQLSLETVSAPIHADVHLYNDGASELPTYLHLTTGNSVLDANVSLYVSSVNSTRRNRSASREPNFRAHAETFNAPLNMTVVQVADTAPLVVHMRAVNNLGTTHVALDSNYAGTFDVNTMFAQADVLTWDGNDFNAHYEDHIPEGASDSDDSDEETILASSDDLSNILKASNKVRLFLPSLGSSRNADATNTDAGRCLEYDLISGSKITGWVGPAPRPRRSLPNGKNNNVSHVEVVSSLNTAQLSLEP